MSRIVRRLGWLAVVALLLVLGLPAEAQVRKYRRCLRKQSRCLKRCKRRIFKRTAKCYRRERKRRHRCITYAYKKGKRCVRRTSCPKADKCYAKCNQKSNPDKCYMKERCAQLKAACQTSCQTPLGFSLRKCLDQTTATMKNCLGPRKVADIACKAQCPKCN